MTTEGYGKVQQPKRRASVSGLAWTVILLTFANIAYWAVFALAHPRIIPWVPRLVLATEAGPFGLYVLGIPHRPGVIVDAAIIALVLVALATLPLWVRARRAGRILFLLVSRLSLLLWFFSGAAWSLTS